MQSSLIPFVFALSATNVAATTFVGFRLMNLDPPKKSSANVVDSTSEHAATHAQGSRCAGEECTGTGTGASAGDRPRHARRATTRRAPARSTEEIAQEEVLSEDESIERAEPALDAAKPSPEHSGPRDPSRTSSLDIGDLATRGVGHVSAGTKREIEVPSEVGANVPILDGDLSHRDLLRLLQRHMPSFRSCYERALKDEEGLEGKMKLALEVFPTGKGSPIRFESDTVESEQLRECITRRSSFWRFPKPSRPLSVSFSVVFTPTM